LKIIFVDRTPLAGLAALEHVASSHGRRVFLEDADFLLSTKRLLYAGVDAGGHEVYALWFPAPRELLARLAESFARMQRLSPDSCRIVRVRFRGIIPRLASLLYHWELTGSARRLLLWHRRRGIDGAGALVDNG